MNVIAINIFVHFSLFLQCFKSGIKCDFPHRFACANCWLLDCYGLLLMVNCISIYHGTVYTVYSL